MVLNPEAKSLIPPGGGGGGDKPFWKDVQNKPFNSVGKGLTVDEQGVLNVEGIEGTTELQIGLPTKITKIEDYAYDMKFEEVDSDFSRAYFESKKVAINVGGCAAIAKGEFLARSYDWKYSNMAEARVTVPPKDGKYGYHGISGSINELTEKFLQTREYSYMYKMVPFYTQDGVNSEGLAAAILVVPTDYGFNDVKAAIESRERKCGLELVNHILTSYTNAKEAANSIRDYVDIFFPEALHMMGYECHYIIYDKNKVVYLLEFLDNSTKIVDISNAPWVTNFFRQGVTLNKDKTVNTPLHQESGKPTLVNGITPHGAGLERHNLIAENYDQLYIEDDFRKLLDKLRYSRLYNTSDWPADPPWDTELVGADDTTVDSPSADYAKAHAKADREWELKDRETSSVWFSPHSVIYNVNNGSMRVMFQESGQEHIYAFPDFNKGGESESVHYIDVNNPPTEPDNGLYVFKASGEAQINIKDKPRSGDMVYYRVRDLPQGITIDIKYRDDGYYDITITEEDVAAEDSILNTRNWNPKGINRKYSKGKLTESQTWSIPVALCLAEIFRNSPFADVLEECGEPEAQFYSLGRDSGYYGDGIVMPLGITDTVPEYWFKFNPEYAKEWDIKDVRVNIMENALIVDGEVVSGTHTEFLATELAETFIFGAFISCEPKEAILHLQTYKYNDDLPIEKIALTVLGEQPFVKASIYRQGSEVIINKAPATTIETDDVVAGSVIQRYIYNELRSYDYWINLIRDEILQESEERKLADSELQTQVESKFNYFVHDHKSPQNPDRYTDTGVHVGLWSCAGVGTCNHLLVFHQGTFIIQLCLSPMTTGLWQRRGNASDDSWSNWEKIGPSGSSPSGMYTILIEGEFGQVSEADLIKVQDDPIGVGLISNDLNMGFQFNRYIPNEREYIYNNHSLEAITEVHIRSDRDYYVTTTPTNTPVDEMLEDDLRPITSGAVFRVVGNILEKLRKL